MSDNIENKLIKMKKSIDDAKQKANQIQGAIEQVRQRLESEFNISSLEEADDMLESIDLEIEQLEEEVKSQLQKLENDYDWS